MYFTQGSQNMFAFMDKVDEKQEDIINAKIQPKFKIKLNEKLQRARQSLKEVKFNWRNNAN